MHDIVDLERRGIPSMFIASSEFISAADAQSASLGFPTVARVFTPHPVQDRTDAEMHAYADLVIADVIAAVTSPASGKAIAGGLDVEHREAVRDE